MRTRIGELLLKNGIITEEQLNKALQLQKKKKKRLGEILIELDYLTSEDLIWMLSEQADIPFVEIHPEMLDKELINTFPDNILYNNCILPLYETEDKVYVAFGDPTNTSAIQKVKKYTVKEVVTSGADPQKIEQLLNKFFLAEQLAKTTEPRQEGKTTIKITSNKAVVEFTDKSGKTTKENASIEVIVNIGKGKETKSNV